MVNVFGVKQVLRASRNWLIADERAYVPGSATADGALLFQVCLTVLCSLHPPLWSRSQA
jgi:hypothetical protein